jgi:hypothetical protein
VGQNGLRWSNVEDVPLDVYISYYISITFTL